MPDNKKRLSLFIGLTTALLLSGCATNQTLPVDKVVLDWKDFEPVKFSPSDNCNTLNISSKDYPSRKVLCFSEQNTPIGNRFLVRFTETVYTKKQWSLAPSDFLTNRGFLYRDSLSHCKGNYRPVGDYGYTCTPLSDVLGEDILVVHDFRKKSSGELSECLAYKTVPLGKLITMDDKQYQTAIKIVNDCLENL